MAHWERLGNKILSGDVSNSTGVTITFEPARFMHFDFFIKATAAMNPQIRFGYGPGNTIDAGTNYAYRQHYGDTPANTSTTTSIKPLNQTSSGNQHISFDLINITNQEKLLFGHGSHLSQWTNDYMESFSAKWGDGSADSGSGTNVPVNNQANAIHVFNAGAGDFKAGTNLIAFGQDSTGGTAPDTALPLGTVFEETDTGKHYMWDGTSAWNEVVSP